MHAGTCRRGRGTRLSVATDHHDQDEGDDSFRREHPTGEHVTILATGKCVAACRRAVLQWPRRAARNVLCIRKEVPAMFAHRQTPPRVAL
jgi:hypothetical protein